MLPPASNDDGITDGEIVLPPDAVANGAYAPLLILDLDSETTALPPGAPAMGRILWEQDGKVRKRQEFAAVLPFLANGRTAVNISLPPPASGDYLVHITLTSPILLEASGTVRVADAAPAVQLLPLQLAEIETACAQGGVSVQLHWLPWGWVDAPQTVYLHLLDDKGERLAQIDEALEPSPTQWLPLQPVITTHQIEWPAGGDLDSLRIGLYAWSDQFQAVIPARFFDSNGRLIDAVTAPLHGADCNSD